LRTITCILFFLPLAFCLTKKANAQASTELGYILRGVVIEGDTMPHSYVRQITILPPFEFKSHSEYLKYRRLVRDVKKVYPYSLLAREVFFEVSSTVDSLDSKKQKRKYVKGKDKELQERYTEELKNLTITQGRILIKLIDRETGSTSYDVVKELRGSVSAFMWQQMARLFGSNLKTGFDADGEDKMIDRIIVMIENGQL